MVTSHKFKLGNQKHMVTFIGILIALAASAVIIWWGYSWYINKKEQAAQKDLAEGIETYNKAFSNPNSDSWHEIERGFSTGAAKHRKTGLYPYFLAYQADALIRQGKYQAAVEALDKAINSLNKNNPNYYLYNTKQALVKIDSGDAKAKEQGIDSLNKLSLNNDNPFQEMALYYLGLQEFYSQNKAKAKEFWQQIINKGRFESDWYHMAKSRLDRLA